MKKNGKKFSGLVKRTIALAVCFAALTQASVFAASSAHRVSGSGKKVIEEETAIDYVCRDLGINAEDAEIESSGVIFEAGQYVYKIYAAYEDMEYIYYVRALDGIITKVTSPTPAEEAQAETETAAEETTGSSIDLEALESEAGSSSKRPASRAAGYGKIISKTEAINYACGDLGIDAEDADIKSADIVLDGGQYVYQVCFIYDGIDYTYNIRVYNGAVVKRTLSPIE